jgi:16S rRNA (guanine527-N7)-methyltransferase
MEPIVKYFPNLDDHKSAQFAALKPLYDDWNAKINLISRKDMDKFYEHHVLHSLSIAKVIAFEPGTRILDVGTGGGFPGIPLAILFPEVRFVLPDSIGKKIKVVRDVAQQIGLHNVEALQIRAEQLNESFDFVVSRAVTDLPTFYQWVRYKIR